MKISGFTFIRNGIKLHYPFIESIRSVLSLCDEMIIAVGKSDDGTRNAIEELREPKIKIIDTVWDEGIKTGGKILARQTNIAFDAITGDWGFYIQGDEVVHEKDLPVIKAAAEKYLPDGKVEGLLFSWIHFFGNYNYITQPQTKGAYPYEVRLIRNNRHIRAYRDAQGFRWFNSDREYDNGDKGRKLRVKKIDASVYHYSRIRGPGRELERLIEFKRLYVSEAEVQKMFGGKAEYEYVRKGALQLFTGSHPQVMQERIKKYNWDFKYDPAKMKAPFKYKISNFIEQKTGLRLFDFRNYKII